MLEAVVEDVDAGPEPALHGSAHPVAALADGHHDAGQAAGEHHRLVTGLVGSGANAAPIPDHQAVSPKRAAVPAAQHGRRVTVLP